MPLNLSWPARAGLLALSVLLLSFSYAPYKQFYLAWVGLVPLLMAVATARSGLRAFGWGWLGGAAFFAINLAWIFRATVPGAIALVMYLALFWGFAAAVVRWSDLFSLRAGAGEGAWGRALFAVAGVPAVWVSAEWVRGTLFTGFPWIPLGQTQSPVVAMCQVADLASIEGVSYWVVAINAAMALALLRRHDMPALLRAGGIVAGLLIVTLGYGLFRLAQDAQEPGPRVMVVQPNFIHQRGGKKIVTQQQQLEFHLGTTSRALAEATPVDLVVWSETVMPGLNPEARDEPGLAAAPFLKSVDAALRQLTAAHRVSLVTGGYFVGGWEGTLGSRRATDIRNAVYVYHADGRQDPQRYDKIHLVPFGEFLPFERSFPPLFRILRNFAGYSVDYSINWALPDAMTVFEIRPSATASDGGSGPVRIVTPICYEDVDAQLLARMFRPSVKTSGRKRADMIVNVTNDGWFLGNQQAQHVQHAIFRSIENRAPTARAANTGISGFIDSNGRAPAYALLPVRTAGTLNDRVMLDRRIAPYTRVGPVFAYLCLAATAGLALIRPLRLGSGARR